jgi:hypothetical protein
MKSMKRITIHVLILLCILTISIIRLNAQTDSIPSDSTALLQYDTLNPGSYNMIKINLFALPLQTFTLQYERVINKFLSASLTVRYMPHATVPFKNLIYNMSGGNDPDFKEILDNMLISNYAITPELRFYLGKKGYGRGFYLAPAYRYAHFTIDKLEYSYINSEDQESFINLSGKMTANYGGFIIGAQWLLGKHLILDWWIFAPFLGAEKTDLSGRTTEPISEEDQDILRQDLEDIDIPYTTTTVSVHEYGASLQLHGLLAGVSSGLAIGVRF